MKDTVLLWALNWDSSQERYLHSLKFKARVRDQGGRGLLWGEHSNYVVATPAKKPSKTKLCCSLHSTVLWWTFHTPPSSPSSFNLPCAVTTSPAEQRRTFHSPVLTAPVGMGLLCSTGAMLGSWVLRPGLEQGELHVGRVRALPRWASRPHLFWNHPFLSQKVSISSWRGVQRKMEWT